jgi:hypothetical protein
VEWVNLQDNTNISEQKTDITITLLNSDTETKLVSSLTGYQALFYRKSYGSNDSLLKANLGRNGYNLSDTKVSITDPDDIKLPYVYECTLKNTTETINNKVYVSPFLNEIISNNPLTQSTRTYPVDMIYPTKKIYTSIIAIPAGYTVDFLPAEDKINNVLCDLNYSATSDGKAITVTFSYTFKNSVYAPADYSKIKYFFGEIVKKGNEKVVLVKS